MPLERCNIFKSIKSIKFGAINLFIIVCQKKYLSQELMAL